MSTNDGAHERRTDYYAILHLTSECSIKEIQEQYRKLVKVFHPDINAGDKWFEDQLKLINDAYEFLSSPERKAAYDDSRRLRTEDIPFIDKPFEAEPEPEVKREEWTFTTQNNPPRREDPPMHSNINWSNGVGAPHVATTNLRRGLSAEEQARSKRFRYVIAVAAVLAIITMTMIIRQQPDDNALAKSVKLSSDIGPSVAYGNSATMSVYVAKELQPIDNKDYEAADKARHDQAVRLRAEVAPLLARYQSVEPRASNLADVGQEILGQMRNEDDSTGKILSPDSTRYQAEVKLANDIRSLHFKLDMIQSQFDDLQYGASDESSSTLQQVSIEVNGLEHESDPLFQDLKR